MLGGDQGPPGGGASVHGRVPSGGLAEFMRLGGRLPRGTRLRSGIVVLGGCGQRGKEKNENGTHDAHGNSCTTKLRPARKSSRSARLRQCAKSKKITNRW